MPELMRSTEDLTVVVLAGAVARGPFEAAVLTELLPKLLPDLRNTIFVGTSAGAINAVLWARFATDASKPLAAIGREVEEVWKTIEYDDVLGSLFLTLARDVSAFTAGLLTGYELRATLLDSSPLRDTVEKHFSTSDLESNIAAGRVAGVGVVATACGDKVASSRSHVFLQAPPDRIKLEPKSADSGLDYIFEPLTVDHVLASSAVPALFSPIRLTARGFTQSYVDGGVRLNTPIAPALVLGAKRIVIVSSHTACYSDNASTPTPFRVSDSIARVLHSVLADGMIEDIRKLRRTNHIVQQHRRESPKAPLQARSGRAYKELEFIVVSPDPGELACRARTALAQSLFDANKNRYRFIRRTLGFLGHGDGADEILSYFFFDPTYTELQLDLGREHAAKITRWELT